MEAPIVNQEYANDVGKLKDRVALFNTFANNHVKRQSINPFSNEISGLQRRRFSKEEYGRPEKGSKSEFRALKANLAILKEMMELCDVLNQFAEPLFTPEEKPNDPRKVISFGELFSIYTAISDKLVGILLRTRKLKYVDFEGECLFQRQDDHVPIFLMKPIAEIRKSLKEKINDTMIKLHENQSPPRELPACKE